MDLLPTTEQNEIAASVASIVANHQAADEGVTDALWSAASEQGWFGLGLSEHAGGVGYGLAEESLVAFELGRACAPGPFVSTMLASHIASAAGNDELAAQFISGTERAAWVELTESGAMVFDGLGAEFGVVLDPHPMLVALNMDTATTLESIDVLVPLHRVNGAPHPVATPGDGDASERIRWQADVLIAALCAGMAAGTTAQSVEYAKDRQQFGQPIGSFQGPKHRCADMAVRAEAALTQTRYAAVAVQTHRPDAAFHASAARAVAVSAAITNAQINVQNHGGIGFTWEHTAHRFVTRSRIVGGWMGGRFSALASLLEQPPAA